MGKRLLVLAIAVLAGFAGTRAYADQVLAAHEGLTATAMGDETCGPVLRVVVTAADRSEFSGEKQKLNVIMKAVRTRLKFDCPQAEDVLIEGEVDGEKVYRGAFSAGTNWTLVDLSAPVGRKPPERKRAETPQPVENKTQLMSLTLSSCETKYKSADFCICAMEQLSKIDLSSAEWELISQDFSRIVDLSRTIEEIKTSFKACYG